MGEKVESVQTVCAYIQAALEPFEKKSLLNWIPASAGMTNGRIFVGYSGGLDSHVLLVALKLLKIPATAIHINHQLSPNSTHWQQHCARTCEILNIPFLSEKVDATHTPGQSPEAAARAARYAVFERLLELNDLLLLGHHEDDQAETVLLQLLRGSGPSGLAAMPSEKSCGKGKLLRPLLSCSRSMLKQFAIDQQLNWIEDESNADPRFNRNYLRHHIIPLLEKRWPSYAKTITRTSRQCAQMIPLMKHWTDEDCQMAAGRFPGTLSVARLLSWPFFRRRAVIRQWLFQHEQIIPSELQLNVLEKNVLNVKPDAQPLLSWANVEIRRYQDDLYALPRTAPWDPTQIIPWDLNNPLVLPQNKGNLPIPSRSFENNVTIRFRQGGESCKLEGRTGHRDLKKIFQDWQIPPWQRNQIPLLYEGENLVAIYDPRKTEFVFCEIKTH